MGRKNIWKYINKNINNEKIERGKNVQRKEGNKTKKSRRNVLMRGWC